MTKEKIKALTKYQTDLRAKLEQPTPEKHKNHPEAYRLFLLNELEEVSAKLDKAKLVG